MSAVIRPAHHEESTSLRVFMRKLVELTDLRTEYYQ